MELGNGRTADWEALGISDGSGGNVCGDCIDDPALREFISANATETSCTYCEEVRPSPFAAPLSKVVEHMAEIINEEFKHDELKAYWQATASIIRSTRLSTSCFWKSDSSQRKCAFLTTLPASSTNENGGGRTPSPTALNAVGKGSAR